MTITVFSTQGGDGDIQNNCIHIRKFYTNNNNNKKTNSKVNDN